MRSPRPRSVLVAFHQLTKLLLVTVLAVAGCATPSRPESPTATPITSSTTDTASSRPSPPTTLHTTTPEAPGPAAIGPPGPTSPDPCGALGAPVASGSLADPTLDEVSGAVLSRRHPGIVWVHEDSGNPPVLTALRLDGTTVATITLEAANVDWEDLALGVGPDGGTVLVIGDIGDNRARRDTVALLRLPEPDPSTGDATVTAERIELTMPTGPVDAEALLVDPRSGDVVIVTKSPLGRAQVLVAPGIVRAPVPDSPVPLELAGVLDLGPLEAVLAADASAAAGLIAVRTPWHVHVWSWTDDRSIADVLLADSPCRAPSRFDPLGEALALDDTGGYLLLGERAGATIWQVGPPG